MSSAAWCCSPLLLRLLFVCWGSEMVTESLLTLIASFVVWIIEGVPAPEPPEWFGSAAQGIEDIDALLSDMSPWIPVGLIGLILTAWAATLATGIGLKLVRIVASFFTAGGGSAA